MDDTYNNGDKMAPSDIAVVADNPSDTACATPTTTSGNGDAVTPQKKSLGLLAEVALTMPYQHLKTEPEDQNKSLCGGEASQQKSSESSSTTTTPPTSSSASASSSPSAKSSPETKIMGRSYSLKQVKKFPEKRLLQTFAEYKRDIKTKRCSYRCQILPAECQQKFDGVGADQQGMIGNIMEHLREHLCNLERDRPHIKLNSCRKVKKRKDKVVAAPVKVEGPPQTAVPLKMEMKSMEPKNDHVYSYHEPSKVAIMVSAACQPLDAKSEEKIMVDEKSFITLTSPVIQLLNLQQQQQQQPTGVAPPHPVENVSQKVEVISTVSDPNIDPPTSTDPAVQARMRALALDYIDDIRKKSSSAAKSVIVNGDKSVIYQCKICPDKQFTSTNGLIFHYKKHAGLKPYVCEICSATFTRQHSLNYHMLIHYNKSRFVCSECSRHFRHPSHFKEHMRRHTGETPFQCADCLIRFKTRNTYKRHLQTKHSKILTSKGIIELPQTVPYQGVPKNQSGSVVAPSKGQPTTVAIQPSTSSVVVRKPRRKYGLPYLHKNIETITKYEQQQQHDPHLLQMSSGSTLITNVSVPSMATNNTVSGTVVDPLGAAITAATAQTAPGSNITIVNIPQLPTVRILDNGGGGGVIQHHSDHQAMARKTGGTTTTLLNYAHNNQRNLPHHSGDQQPQSIALLTYPSQHQFHAAGEPIDHQLRTALDSSRTVLTPIQMSVAGDQLAQQLVTVGARIGHPTSATTTTTTTMVDGRNITELGSAVPLIGGTGSPTTLYLHNPHHLNPINLQLMTTVTTGTTTTTNATATTTATVVAAPANENFMRLLEAIELTEV